MQYNSFFRLHSTTNFFMRLNGQTKLMVLVVVALLTVLINNPKSLLLLFYSLFALHLLTYSSAASLKCLVILVSLSMWGTIGTQSMFYASEPRTELFCLVSSTTPFLGAITGGIYIYYEGILYGAEQGLRGSIMILMGLLLCWNLSVKELLKVLEMWRLPHEIAFMVTAAIRFLPIVFEETETVLTAQRLKGIDVRRTVSIRQCIKLAQRTFLPILVRSIRRAGILAMSVETRGFPAKRLLPENDMVGSERILNYCLIILLILVIVAKILQWLQVNGIYYSANLHKLYDFVNAWM